MRFQTTLEGAECLRRMTLDGKVFQARGAATKNAPSPIVVRHEDGVTRADVDELYCRKVMYYVVSYV